MTYQQTLDYIYAQLPMFSKIGAAAIKNGFDNILALCSSLGDPQKKTKFIHVAGTNGKGSVSHMLASAFQKQGYKTRLYTSPHLLDFRERVKINGKMISEQEVVEFIEKMLDLFCEQTPQVVREMREAYEAGDLEAMGERAHKIKSSLEYFSMVTIKDAVREIEKAGVEKNNTAALPGLLQFTEQTVLEAVRLMQQDRAGLHEAAGKGSVFNASDTA